MCSARNLPQPMTARLIKLACLSACSLFLCATSVLADLGVSVYAGATGTGKTTAQGDVYVNFTLIGFTGSVGNATFSNASVSIPIQSGYQGGVGQRLAAIPYSVTSGSLIITEVK